MKLKKLKMKNNRPILRFYFLLISLSLQMSILALACLLFYLKVPILLLYDPLIIVILNIFLFLNHTFFCVTSRKGRIFLIIKICASLEQLNSI